MKTYLLPKEGKYYKANMHCHSNLSDGSFSIEELKKIYMDKGYSIIAFTDHDKYISHNDLNDDEFLAINSYEVDISEKAQKTSNHIKCYHINFYDTKEKREKEHIIPKYPDYYDIDGINKFIKTLNDEGFIACYNHPHWSLQNLDDYRNLEGLFALEIYNYSAYIGGTPEDQSHVFDDFLRMGKRIFCIASDDNHNRRSIDSPSFDSFGGFIMIKAENLNTKDVFDSLKKGHFYSSNSPLIEELYIEGCDVHIKTSPVRSISLSIAGRDSKRINVADNEVLTEAVFTLNPKDDIYFRLELVDHKGYKAYTNAYFFDDI